MNQPLERPIKKVLVSARCQGRVAWTLATATKVGRSYQVDQSVLFELASRVRGDNSQNLVLIG